MLVFDLFRIKDTGNNIKKKSELTLENYGEQMSPEWLKSLLVKGPKQWVSGRIAKKLQDDAEGCLKLLKVILTISILYGLVQCLYSPQD